MQKLNALLATVLLLSSAHSGAADLQAGQARAATCVSCHGAKGISAAPIYPNLAGQKAAYLEKQLKAFKAGARKDPVMEAMAKPLNDTDIANLAAYFSSL